MRSGARTAIHPFQDRPDIAFPIRYEEVPFDRSYLDRETVFVFDQWSQRDGVEDAFPGIETAYRYYSGAPTQNLQGLGVCGSESDWLGNAVSTAPPLVVDPVSGFPLCCGRAVPIFAGGEADGGEVFHVTPSEVAAGGEAAGGLVIVSQGPVLSAGGEAHGGELVPITGGEAHGGAALASSAAGQLAGGEAHGGAGQPSANVIAKGGEAHGGSVTRLPS